MVGPGGLSTAAWALPIADAAAGKPPTLQIPSEFHTGMSRRRAGGRNYSESKHSEYRLTFANRAVLTDGIESGEIFGRVAAGRIRDEWV